MLLTHLVFFSFLAGASAADAPPAAAETFSGGWSRTESRAKREARIKSERVKLGIIEPDPEPPAAVESQAVVSPVVSLPLAPDPGLAVDLAGLYAGAWLDQEIARFFREQDDDDAAVLLLAIATLH